MFRIDLNQKFTSVHFEEVISKFWNPSFESSTIHFDMSRLEWIAIEQITFLISWINQLADLDKSVTVFLPDVKGTIKDDYIYKRRQNCLNYLFSDWRFTDLLANNVSIIDGQIPVTRKTKKSIPYHEVDLIPYNASSFDKDFFELYETEFKTFVGYIEKEIKWI